MTPTEGKWTPISTAATNTAGVNIFSGVTIPAAARGAVITFDSQARVSIGETDASSTFGHLFAGGSPFFIDCITQIARLSDFVTACAPGAAVPPAGFVTFYEMLGD